MSIGHSTHPLEVFVSLLWRHRVEVVVDVRTSPFSRFNPQFNREKLQIGLGNAGVGYLFLGGELGGRPGGNEFYDPDGHVLYARLAKTGPFETGISRLLQGADRFRVALMCSEEDPAHCHRFLLITRVLFARGFRVAHIRAKGRIQATEDVSTFRGWADPVYEEPSLLDESVRSPWRSTQSVSRRSEQRRSSSP